MADLDLDFKPPRRSAVQHWAVVEFLRRRGFAYHSCGCDGPGYRPSRRADMPAFLDAQRRRPAPEILAARFADRRRARGAARAATQTDASRLACEQAVVGMVRR